MLSVVRRVRGLVARTSLVLACWGASGALFAVEVGDLYQASVEASGRGAAQQKKAMNDAMKVVAAKVTGHDVSDSAMAPLLAQSDRLMQGYSWSGGRGQPLRLDVSFDTGGVNAALKQAGLPVWGTNRPMVLLWVVLDDDGKRHMVSGDQDAALAAIVQAQVTRRGIPVNLALNDVQDVGALSPADVWGHFEDRIRAASLRYHPEVIASGRLHAGANGWEGDWQLSLPGGTRTTTTTGADAAASLQAGLDWMSREVASVYAGDAMPVATNDGPAMPVVIEGVTTLEQYAAMMSYLEKAVFLKGVRLDGVKDGRVSLTLRLGAASAVVLESLRTEGHLVEQGEATEGPHHFDWRG